MLVSMALHPQVLNIVRIVSNAICILCIYRKTHCPKLTKLIKMNHISNNELTGVNSLRTNIKAKERLNCVIQCLISKVETAPTEY